MLITNVWMDKRRKAMKTKEELQEIIEKAKELDTKVAELSAEELDQVTGGLRDLKVSRELVVRMLKDEAVMKPLIDMVGAAPAEALLKAVVKDGPAAPAAPAEAVLKAVVK